MDSVEKEMDTLKQGRKTTEPRVCEEHNVLFVETEYRDKDGAYRWLCPKCTKEWEEEQNVLAEKNKRQLNLDSFVGSLPKRLKIYSFETFLESKENKKIRSICIKYAEKWPECGGLVMLGGVGTGKTHLAIALCRELCLKGVSCKLTTVNKIVRDIRSVWGKNPQYYEDNYGQSAREKTEATVIEDYNKIDLLVIDEIGSQYGSDSEKIIVNEIINNRYEDMKPTVVMGNVSLSEINTILGERVVDRLIDGGHLLFFEWGSLRKHA